MLKLPAPLLVALMGAVPALPGAFVLAGILSGPGTEGILEDLVNPRYFAQPWPIALHIGAGIVFCLLVPFQFSPRLRRYSRRWHRQAGRIAMGAGIAFGLTALPALGPVTAEDGWLRHAGLAAVALGFCAALALSFAAILRRDIVTHRAWALRAVAIGLMGATSVLIETAAFLVLGGIGEMLAGGVIFAAVALNLLIVEFHMRARPLPHRATPL